VETIAGHKLAMVRERIAQLGKIENVLAVSRQQGEASVPTHRVAGEHSGVLFRHGFLDDIRGRTDIVSSSAGCRCQLDSDRAPARQRIECAFLRRYRLRSTDLFRG